MLASKLASPVMLVDRNVDVVGKLQAVNSPRANSHDHQLSSSLANLSSGYVRFGSCSAPPKIEKLISREHLTAAVTLTDQSKRTVYVSTYSAIILGGHNIEPNDLPSIFKLWYVNLRVPVEDVGSQS